MCRFLFKITYQDWLDFEKMSSLNLIAWLLAGHIRCDSGCYPAQLKLPDKKITSLRHRPAQPWDARTEMRGGTGHGHEYRKQDHGGRVHPRFE